MQKPNVVFVFADQWRAQAVGYAGDPNVKTPNLDALARESVNFTHAISGCPVCSPYRASLLTGQRPLTHGVFLNDAPLRPQGPGIAQVFAEAGYATAYIGKWHVGGHGRSAFIPQERRLGFQYWKALECTHDYNHSAYYAGDSDTKLYWHGYDAFAQTQDAVACIRERAGKGPFFLMLSWGPPHEPYHTAPPEYRRLYEPSKIIFRPNVPSAIAQKAGEWLAGYYAHCSALDACVGELIEALWECESEENTVFIFTSDHGDMLGSQGEAKKQRPWDESLRVPFLLRYPALYGRQPREASAPIDAPDIMPTLLGICGIPKPKTVEGLDFSKYIAGGPDPSGGAALIMCPQPFGQWTKQGHGGREYRGLRTVRYTYVRDLHGPWLLYDNEEDPFQTRNLEKTRAAAVAAELDRLLAAKLAETGDAFRPGVEYLKKWNYRTDATGTLPYSE